MGFKRNIRQVLRYLSKLPILRYLLSAQPLELIYALIFSAVGLFFLTFALALDNSIAVATHGGVVSGCATVVANKSAYGGYELKFGSGTCASAQSKQPDPSKTSRTVSSGPSYPLPSLPLTTNGRFIVSKSNPDSRVKLVSASWFGFEEASYAPAGLDRQSLTTIVTNIKKLGINSVRLLWATDTWNANPVVPSSAVAANPDLKGLHVRDLMDRVVNELARQGIMVILDNHNSTAEWCCSSTDGNALWWENYNPAAPPSWSTMTSAQQMQLYEQGNNGWLQAWQDIITRYGPHGSDPQPAVVGADLRNEPRNDSTLGLDSIWGGPSTPVYENWQQAATNAGDKLQAINPNLLIIVEGVNYSVYFGGFDDNTDLPVNPANGDRGVIGYPVQLSVPHQLVYSPHNYSWDTGTSATKLGQWWGYLLGKSSYQAPVWLGEFGTCNTSVASCLGPGTAQGAWWQTITSYLQAGDIDWSYWTLNGTTINGSPEGYGLLNPAWNGEALPALTQSLRNLEPITQRP